MGAGCTGSSLNTPSVSTAPVAQSAITVASPKANETVTNPLAITGQAPVGQTVYAAAVVDGNPVSLTLDQPDEAGNFTLKELGLDRVTGDFSLVVYNINENGDWLNQVTIPLHLRQ